MDVQSIWEADFGAYLGLQIMLTLKMIEKSNRREMIAHWRVQLLTTSTMSVDDDILRQQLGPANKVLGSCTQQ